MTSLSKFVSRRGLLATAAWLVGISYAGTATLASAANEKPLSSEGGETAMKTFLVHIHTGPENPTTAALGFLVAMTALKAGHKVDLFLAGDGALLIGDSTLNTLEGKGTGKLSAHYKALVDGGARFYVSGMSAKARGLGDADLVGKPAEFAMPDVLVRLAAAANVVLIY